MKGILTLMVLMLLHTAAPTDKVATRFKAPAGFSAVTAAPGSFGAYLHNLPLKPAGTPTRT